MLTRNSAYRTVFWVVVFTVIVGAGYGYGQSPGFGGLWRGAVTSVATALPVALFEVHYKSWNIGQALLRQPFWALMLAKSVIYLALFLFGSSVGALTSTIPDDRPGQFLNVTMNDVVFAYAMALVINLALEINRLIGPGVLLRFVTGRYHAPREEERIFLCLDLIGSTAIAAKIGNAQFLRLLDRCYTDLDRVVHRFGGEIHKYVGDEMIVTWTMDKGLRDANCLYCLLAAQFLIAGRAGFYRQAFGVAPRFRAALHGGLVVSGEIGDSRREIVYLGDALNIAARLEEAAKTLGAEALVSQTLLDRLAPLPNEVLAQPLAPVAIKGVATAVPVARIVTSGTPERIRDLGFVPGNDS